MNRLIYCSLKQWVLCLALSLLPLVAQATTYLKPVLDGTIRDVNPKDGIPNNLDDAFMNVYNDPLGAGRGVIEFNLSALGPVENATLVLPVMVAVPPYPFSIEVYGYAGDGALTLADWNEGSLLRTYSYAGENVVGFDVTQFIQQRISNGDTYGGFGFRRAGTSGFESSVEFYSIEYQIFPNLAINVPSIPEPGSWLLMAMGLLGVFLYRSRISGRLATGMSKPCLSLQPG